MRGVCTVPAIYAKNKIKSVSLFPNKHELISFIYHILLWWIRNHWERYGWMFLVTLHLLSNFSYCLIAYTIWKQIQIFRIYDTSKFRWSATLITIVRLVFTILFSSFTLYFIGWILHLVPHSIILQDFSLSAYLWSYLQSINSYVFLHLCED